MGIRLIEVPDWNCCGSSSAHSIDHDLAIDLASRNLALAPAGRPAGGGLPELHPAPEAGPAPPEDRRRRARSATRNCGGGPSTPTSESGIFSGLLAEIGPERLAAANGHAGLDLSFVPYYGCMLNRPYELRATSEQHGIMETHPEGCGHAAAALGPRLAVLRYLSDRIQARHRHPHGSAIMKGAAESGADCIVTACAMCHMNLEVRCTVRQPIPIFHFSEILALAHGTQGHRDWFSRHLIDPRPLLVRKGLYPSGK